MNTVPKHQMEIDRYNTVDILKRSWDSIYMTGKAITHTGREIEVSGTYAMSPGLSFYNQTDGWWITIWRWKEL